MPKITPARHIHKTLSYLSPEKYAALRHPMPFKRLPFIHVSKCRLNSYWAVPATGEYFGGYEVGAAMAEVYLKHLATSDESTDAYMLLNIINDQTERLRDAIERHQCNDLLTMDWPTEPASLRGQQAGFVNTMGKILCAIMKPMGTAFDDVDEQSLVERGNLALTGTDAEMTALAERLDKKKKRVREVSTGRDVIGVGDNGRVS